MSTRVFPYLPGSSALPGWPIKRTARWNTDVPEAWSGKRTIIPRWTYPRFEYEFSFALLRQAGPNQQMASWNATVWNEFATFFGFNNLVLGRGDSWLYTDPDDFSAAAQAFGVGDGSTALFQLAANLVDGQSGFVMPILAPNTVTDVKVNGVTKTLGTGAGNYNVTLWGGTYLSGGGASTDPPGSVRFGSSIIPAAAATLTWDGTYYFPCQFDEDVMSFSKFMAAFYELKSVKFSTLK